MKYIHIIAGFLALASGFIAIYSLKGGKLHRKSGILFVYTMLVMGGLGTVMAALQPSRISVVAGLLVCYLVTTSLLTVRRRPGEQSGPIDTIALLVAVGISIAAFAFGFIAASSPNGTIDQLPAAPAFMFGTVALLAAIGDMRMLARGIDGARRIARHLWRMSFALWIAAASFFLGQAKVFPEPLRKPLLLSVPVLLVLVTMFYWLIRVRRQRSAYSPVRAAGIAPRRDSQLIREHP